MTVVKDLYTELQALLAEQTRRSTEYDAARDRFKAIEPALPVEMIVTNRDFVQLDRSWFRPVWPIECERRTVPAEGWRAMHHSPPKTAAGEPSAAVLARVSEGLAAAEAYEAAFAEARRMSGFEAAEAADLAASERVWEMQHKIAAAVPENLNDVRLKAIAVDDWLKGAASETIVDELLGSLTALPGSGLDNAAPTERLA